MGGERMAEFLSALEGNRKQAGQWSLGAEGAEWE